MGGPIPQAKCFGKAKAGELEKLGKCRGVDFLILFRFYSVFFFFFKFSPQLIQNVFLPSTTLPPRSSSLAFSSAFLRLPQPRTFLLL